MTPGHIRVVQSTWVKVLPIKDSASQLFYERLFATDPSLRALFGSDMRQQGEKLMQVIDGAVNGLSRLECIVGLIRELGRRHTDYGVQDHHYDLVGAALLWTLGKSSGLRVHAGSERRLGNGLWGAGQDDARGDCRRGGQECFASAAPRQKECGMTAVHSRRALAGIIDHTGAVRFVTALGVAAALGLSTRPTVDAVQTSRPPVAGVVSAPSDASRFILNTSGPAGRRLSMCGAALLLRSCATRSLWSSSSPPPGCAVANTASCAMVARFALR